jgi:hypothetical protein
MCHILLLYELVVNKDHYRVNVWEGLAGSLALSEIKAP